MTGRPWCIIYFYVSVLPQSSWFKTMYIFYLTVSVSQESGYGLAGSSSSVYIQGVGCEVAFSSEVWGSIHF